MKRSTSAKATISSNLRSISQFAHAENGAAQKNIFAAGQLGMEAGADFEQAADAAVERGAALGGARDAREHFEQRGFAGAVSADHADDFALLNFERNVADGPDVVLRLALAVEAKGAREHVTKREVPLALAHAVALANPLDADGYVTHNLRAML